jgi:hypothetical protein
VSEGSGSQIGPNGAGPESQVDEPRPGVTPSDAPVEKPTSVRVCPWCSAAVPALVSTCPTCHATLDPDVAEAIHLPGVTEVSPDLRDYAEQARAGKKLKPSLLSMLLGAPKPQTQPIPPASGEADALRPPSPAVRAEMARIDAEIAGIAPPSDPSEDPPAPAEAFPATATASPEEAQFEGPARPSETSSSTRDDEPASGAATPTDPRRRPPAA